MPNSSEETRPRRLLPEHADATVEKVKTQQSLSLATECPQCRGRHCHWKESITTDTRSSWKESIKAQYTASEAQVKISEAATGISEEMADVGLAIQRAQDKTEQMQARAGALDELVARGALTDFTNPGDGIDRQLAQVSTGSNVDRQFETMKKELDRTEQQQQEAKQ